MYGRTHQVKTTSSSEVDFEVDLVVDDPNGEGQNYYKKMFRRQANAYFASQLNVRTPLKNLIKSSCISYALGSLIDILYYIDKRDPSKVLESAFAEVMRRPHSHLPQKEGCEIREHEVMIAYSKSAQDLHMAIIKSRTPDGYIIKCAWGRYPPVEFTVKANSIGEIEWPRSVIFKAEDPNRHIIIDLPVYKSFGKTACIQPGSTKEDQAIINLQNTNLELSSDDPRKIKKANSQAKTYVKFNIAEKAKKAKKKLMIING